MSVHCSVRGSKVQAGLASESQQFLQEDRCLSSRGYRCFWPTFQNKSFYKVWSKGRGCFLQRFLKLKITAFLVGHLGWGNKKTNKMLQDNNRQEEPLQAKMKLWGRQEHLLERRHAGSSSDNVTLGLGFEWPYSNRNPSPPSGGTGQHFVFVTLQSVAMGSNLLSWLALLDHREAVGGGQLSKWYLSCASVFFLELSESQKNWTKLL